MVINIDLKCWICNLVKHFTTVYTVVYIVWLKTLEHPLKDHLIGLKMWSLKTSGFGWHFHLL